MSAGFGVRNWQKFRPTRPEVGKGIQVSMGWAFGFCAAYLIAAFVTDLRSMKIPNVLTVSSMVLGLLYHGTRGGWEGLAFSLQGLGAGFFIVLLMYWIGAVGAGDVKLFGGIGAWTGVWFTLQSVMYSVLFAGAIALVILLRRRETLRRMRTTAGRIAGLFRLRSPEAWGGSPGTQLRFPFMIAVLPGVVSAYIMLQL